MYVYTEIFNDVNLDRINIAAVQHLNLISTVEPNSESRYAQQHPIDALKQISAILCALKNIYQSIDYTKM